MAARLRETIDHLRADIGKVDEPQFKAMFETIGRELLGRAGESLRRLREEEREAPGPRTEQGKRVVLRSVRS
jgi:hypothetical protein